MSTENETTTPMLVYILYLAGLVFPVTALVGLIIAYVYRSDAPDWLASHYQLQIRTFWIGLLIITISFLLTLILIGYFIALLGVIWLIVRCIRGLRYLNREQAYPNPTGWWL